MNLQLHLLIRILLTGALCLGLVGVFVLAQSQHSAQQEAEQIAASLGNQLEAQLRLKDAGLGRASAFPDFELWKQSGVTPGICVHYRSADGSLSRSLCQGSKPVEAGWPWLFETAYRWFFSPGRHMVRPITAHGVRYGSLSVSAGADRELASAWLQICSLMALSSVTVLAVCLLVYVNVSRALQPSITIVSGLQALGAGDLSYRLPAFELNEWRQIAAAVNRMAAGQQQLLEERRRLAVRLIDLQEDERRFLARELHDEFGQCLAAINAVAASIKLSAQSCPDITGDVDGISRIAEHMLQNLRAMLSRLRPAELDEFGLAVGLNSLVTAWNSRGAGRTRYLLQIVGDCELLTEKQATALFRIAQESITNAAKHAKASHVTIVLMVGAGTVSLTIEDDGIARRLPFPRGEGVGLLGIRERVADLGGQLSLAIAEPQGLIVQIQLPLYADQEKTA